ncbi:hypothetical protein [Couchioplanes caeruleus]|uniref:Uncharacterized protein n=2 Tax=Couchioplanes caeruleus TaxID=56438 RepID=A0A1K0GFY3_9ACTN|nr:hypothetical protein [Couchioplanes caeruleus]OJF09756.1 hypothetical protein BG844_35805 [Couchioplanes caeruleus subsp. caeruleus]ROP28350.1 hypothetical protein EDD30_1099 [Couchioplanes caeruleus]
MALLLAGVAGVAGWRWWHHRVPYGPEALNAHATLEVVDQATADAALKPGNAEQAEDGDQIFLGRVVWNRPPNPQKGGSFRVVVLDKRSHLPPGFIAVASAEPDAVSTGSDGSLDIAQQRYSWLRGAGTREVNGQAWSSGSAIYVDSVDASPVTFQFVLRPARPQTPPENMVATGPAKPEDLLVALISAGSDGQVYWAQRLLN